MKITKSLNLTKMSEEDIKRVSLQILTEFHHFCEENGLKYTLFYGSLLGAIRHKGFIPWDDDIDVAMPRDDYNFFVTHFSNDKFSVVDCFSNKDYYLPWAKMFDKRTLKIEQTPHKSYIGLNIDIFPIDFVNDYNSYLVKRGKIKKTIKRLVLSNTSYKTQKKAYKRILLYFLNILLRRHSNKWAQRINNAMINDGHSSFSTSNGIFCPDEKYFFKTNIFAHLSLLPFENNCFYCSDDYDIILKTHYGDYMVLPNKSNQKTHHNFESYFIE